MKRQFTLTSKGHSLLTTIAAERQLTAEGFTLNVDYSSANPASYILRSGKLRSLHIHLPPKFIILYAINSLILLK